MLPEQAPALLLVDDEVNILRAVDRLMAGTHMRVLTFSDPTEALPHLSDPSVVVIVSDFRMPLFRGTDVLARAQKDNRFARRILLSAYADLEGSCENITASCIHQFITKPYEPASLRATLLQCAVDALFDTLIARIPSLMKSLQTCTSEAEVRALVESSSSLCRAASSAPALLDCVMAAGVHSG